MNNSLRNESCKNKINTNYEFFFRGAVSGMVGTLLSYPCDTIKTCAQTKTLVKYTPAFLYNRGIMFPLVSVGIEKAGVFGIYNNLALRLKKYNLNPVLNDIICGAVAGVSVSFIVAPAECFKIRHQINQVNREMFKPKNLFHGLLPTFFRETLGFAIYFPAYNLIERNIYNDNITTHGAFLAGGFAGCLSWTCIYPPDMIKTKMQSGLSDSKTFLQIGQDIYKIDGLKGFWKGAKYAYSRAFLLHGGAFATMELFKKHNIK